ncbi:Na+/H+ antiporter subunit E [Streptomyces sp. P38-E01]|uniref:Na+/H+ antiporter subunit E n=1 Tax=Streptomyces tardus TaxID=2780544 RepID=A0A949JED0_9ACTN|nr:Na+/H+ antiporter subunit E [Streptomyces tardus]MBU7597897.1 Na+/H+ antiporter subunit E [Streptomyces tardus]
MSTQTEHSAAGGADPPPDVPANEEDGRPSGALRGRLVQVVGLLLLWIVLWGSVSAVVLLFGVIVAVGVALLCPVPTTRFVLIKPWRLLALAGRTAAHLVSSGATVAWEAVRHGPRTRSAVVAVPLQMDTDRLVRGAVQLTGLSPGSLVLEIDRERRVLYVHSLPVWDAEEAEKRRSEVLAAEAAILRAFGDTVPSGGTGAGSSRAPGPGRSARGAGGSGAGGTGGAGGAGTGGAADVESEPGSSGGGDRKRNGSEGS